MFEKVGKLSGGKTLGKKDGLYQDMVISLTADGCQVLFGYHYTLISIDT